MGQQREWLWRVLLPFLWFDLLLGVAVSAAIVIPEQVTDESMQSFVSVYLPAAVGFGLVFGSGAWLVSLCASVAFAKLMPGVPRVPAISMALAIPGILALALYRPWESETVGLVSGTVALLVALTLAVIAGVLVISRAERRERSIDGRIEAD